MWTKDAPKKAGFYWFAGKFQDTPIGRPIIIEVTRDKRCWFAGTNYGFMTTSFNGQWSGPILPPGEADKEG